MKIAVYVLLPFLCIYSVFAGKKKEKKPVEITRMECYSVAWNANTSNRQFPRDIVSRDSNLFDKVTIHWYPYLRDLQIYIDKLEIVPDTNSAYVDARIVCLLYKSNKTIDTLSFGGFHYCQYNGKFYYPSWQLLSHILKKAPHEQYEQVNWHLQNNPQIKARLEERDK